MINNISSKTYVEDGNDNVHQSEETRSALQFQIRSFRFTFRFKYENRSGVWRIKCRITQFISTQ
jgi:hypothetical protein